MHPLENVGSSLIPTVFDGTGYVSCIRGVLRGLSIKNTTDFINEKVKKPSPDLPDYTQWKRCGDMVTSWIFNLLSWSLTNSLQYVNNNKDLWDELEYRYDQTNDAKMYQL